MANSIEKMLQINTQLEKGAGQIHKTGNNGGGRRVASQQDLDRLIEQYDSQVFGPIPENMLQEQESHKYNAEEEMKRLKEIEAQGGRPAINLEGRNIPREIVESIINNPLDLKPIEDTRMTQLEKKIANKGIQNAVNVLKKVETKEKEERMKLNEGLTPSQPVSSNVDYGIIKAIVQECLKEAKEDLRNEFKTSLNESAGHQAYVPSMKYLSFKDNFYLVDNDDNVFECVMKYKGKRKKK